MQEKKSRRPNAQRSEEMRSRLIAAARALFVEKGFAETGTPEIVRAADVTRGALYHHFADKTDLFRAVAHAEAAALEQDITSAAQAADTAEEALRAGAQAFFAAMSKPGRARLLLIDGPAVLGVAEMDGINAGNGRRSLAEGLRAMMPDAGPDTIRTLSETLGAAFDRAALAVSDGGDPDLYATALIRQMMGAVRG